jgi:F-type H+/Na+-transporting ATPase subunit alpha
MIFAGTNGYLDKLPVADVGRFEDALLTFMHSKKPEVLDWITNEDPKIKGDAADKLKAAIDEFAADFA